MRVGIRFLLVAVIGVLCLGLITPRAQAAPMVVQTEYSGDSAYVVSANDLINGVQPGPGSVLGPTPGMESTNSSPSVLTDGQFGPVGGGSQDRPNGPITGQSIFVASSSTSSHTVLIYTLPPVAGGYEITGINTYTGWNDDGRSRQDYVVSYTTENDALTFIPLTTVSHAQGGKNQFTELAITGLSGVTAIKFDFPHPQQNTYVGYRELDVFGSPVPEPAGLAVMGLGLCGLAARRRRV